MHVPTRRAPPADLPTRGGAKPPHLAARVPRADLPTAWGGETSPPGWARSARRPPHCVGRRNLPTRRVPRADLPAERGGETSPPGCARSARRPPHCVGRRNLPTWLRALRAPTSPLRGEA